MTENAPDPITVGVVSSGLRAIAMEMSEALHRSSHSPIIREMLDFSCGVFTAEGETVAQDDLIPAFLGTMASTMPWVIEAAEGREPRPGDLYIANDPFRGGTHTPDIQIFAPILHDGRLIAWCGNIAHHSDVGGTNPGSEGFANRSIFEEGVRIPPLLLARGGDLNQGLLRLIENNIRDPQSTAGDIRAQIAAVRLGARQFERLIARHGVDNVTASMYESLDQAERRIRAAIAARPDGTSSAEGFLDNDGLQSEAIRIAVRVTVNGDTVDVDLTGSAGPVAGGLNMAPTSTKSSIYFAVKAIFDPEAPHNGGPLRAVTMTLPKGSFVNASHPSAVSLRHIGVLRLADTMIRAFGQLYPDTAAAGAFVGFPSMAAACRHPRRGHEVIIQDDLGGGLGAHAFGDGIDAVDPYLGNLQILPAEICELQYPVRIVSTELVQDSAGPGQFRGGLGIRRVYEFLDTTDCVFYSDQNRADFAPHGLAGGHDGSTARGFLDRGAGEPARIAKTRFAAEKGDRLIIVTGGGGGFGDPRDRDRSAVRRDLAEGKISRRVAQEVYGLAEVESVPGDARGRVGAKE